MREIIVFYDNTSYTLTWLRALVWAKDEFERGGVKVRFDTIKAPLPKMSKWLKTPATKEDFISYFSRYKKLDIVFLAYHHSSSSLCRLSVGDRAEVLRYLHHRCSKLVWLDTADGTGTCMFDVMPNVDRYLKKQVLKDRTRYFKPIWGNRIFAEYYHETLEMEETGQREKQTYETLKPEYVDKLDISWNVGLGDLFTKSDLSRIVYRNRYKMIRFCEPSDKYKYLVHYRGSFYPGAIGYPRRNSEVLLNRRTDIKKPDITKKVPYDEYVNECKESLALLSPFGWGEICGRDFEAFVFGNALIKQDMSHMETYPNVYREYETYIPIKWDFSDFNDMLDRLKTVEGQKMALSIAQNGQRIYKEYYCHRKREFAERIIKMVL